MRQGDQLDIEVDSDDETIDAREVVMGWVILAIAFLWIALQHCTPQ